MSVELWVGIEPYEEIDEDGRMRWVGQAPASISDIVAYLTEQGAERWTGDQLNEEEEFGWADTYLVFRLPVSPEVPTSGGDD